jgi:hypothetical protein
MKRVEEYEVLLQQLRTEDTEEYNMIKIKLDTDVQVDGKYEKVERVCRYVRDCI